MLSIIVDPSLEYPGPSDDYSPDERFPEYRSSYISTGHNDVYRGVRDCLAQAGLDRAHFGTAAWNPLGEYVAPGNKVFVLCNFMSNRVPSQSVLDHIAECTHASVLRPVIDYLLLATGPNGSVSFGNAPIQYCDWEAVQRETGADVVERFYRKVGAPVKAMDLRLFAARFDRKKGMSEIQRRRETDGVPVNLGADSLLVELDRDPKVRYRVVNYNAQRTSAFHSGGRHTYVINRAILEADVIFNLCKLKTHEKVGITCSLKGVVGTVGHKDSLPHHRFGPPEAGGDEYPEDRTRLLRLVSGFHERVQSTRPDDAWGSRLRVVDRFVRSVAIKASSQGEGAWWGNDTAWRMVLDLARIAVHADSTGELHSLPLRKHVALVDGIVGGEGDGPYLPTPYRSGLLLFGDNPPAVDYVAAIMMGYKPELIPLVRESFSVQRYPVLVRPLHEEQIVHNGRDASLEELRAAPRHHYVPPPGWMGRL